MLPNDEGIVKKLLNLLNSGFLVIKQLFGNIPNAQFSII